MRHPFFQFFAGTILLVGLLPACKKETKEAKPVPPSEQSHPIKESELNTLTLTEKAVERLGIQVDSARQQSVGNNRTFSGEVVTIPGKTVTLTAPMAGTVLAARNGSSLTAGQPVQKGQTVYRLLILPSEKDLLSVQEDVAQRQIQYETAVAKRNRAAQLLKEKAGSQRAVEEAEAELAGIAAQLKTAKARLELLKGNNPQGMAERLSTLNVDAPISGFVQQVYTASSQVVAAGAPIADLANVNTLWIRVPAYAGDAGKINAQATATVQMLSDFSGSAASLTARPVQGPPTANAQATTFDLYYEIANPQGNFRPGQKVSVSVPFKGNNAQGVVIPYSAIVYDIHGGTWVYQNDTATVFSRRRVELAAVENGMAVVKRGLTEGARIVITGAAELFGTEFGGGK